VPGEERRCGLRRQTAPIEFDDQLKRWNRVGTFVALAGAFHGLGPSSVGEWESDGAFMTRLMAETAGGGGETPYGTNDPTTPEPAHNIRYFCLRSRRVAERTEHNNLNLESRILDSLDIHRDVFLSHRGDYCFKGTVKGVSGRG
jgi:hypothetical protein